MVYDIFCYIYCGERGVKLFIRDGGAQLSRSLMYLQNTEIWIFNHVEINRCDCIFFQKVVVILEHVALLWR